MSLAKRHKGKTSLLVGGYSASQHNHRSVGFNSGNKCSIDPHELEFYGSLVERFRATASQSLLNKRAAIAKEDPAQELIDVHLEVHELDR